MSVFCWLYRILVGLLVFSSCVYTAELEKYWHREKSKADERCFQRIKMCAALGAVALMSCTSAILADCQETRSECLSQRFNYSWGVLFGVYGFLTFPAAMYYVYRTVLFRAEAYREYLANRILESCDVPLSIANIIEGYLPHENDRDILALPRSNMKVIGAMLMATSMPLLGIGSTWYYVKNVHHVYDFSCIESTDQELMAQHDRHNYACVLVGGIGSGIGLCTYSIGKFIECFDRCAQRRRYFQYGGLKRAFYDIFVGNKRN